MTGVKRQAINFKNLALTDIVIEIPRCARQMNFSLRFLLTGPTRPFHTILPSHLILSRAPRQKTLTKAFNDADVIGKWEKTSWGKKRAARAQRANLTDFDRFKVMVAKKKRNVVIGTETRKLVKADNKKKAAAK